MQQDHMDQKWLLVFVWKAPDSKPCIGWSKLAHCVVGLPWLYRLTTILRTEHAENDVNRTFKNQAHVDSGQGKM